MTYAGDTFECEEKQPDDQAMEALLADPEFEEARNELAEAFDRLEKDPTIRSPEHEGIFTYEDPVLANAALTARENGDAAVSPAAVVPGEELTSKMRWMLMGVKWMRARMRSDEYLKDLASISPKPPTKFGVKPFRIAVVGDAGFKGYAQDTVLKMMLQRHKESPFDIAIHLGDVYFAAGIKQMQRNFLVPFSALRNLNCPVYTLCGNHDLYYGAEAYRESLTLLNQPGRYFSIENDHWRVACLDTSLGAATIMGNDGRLDDGQIAWLQGLLELNDGKRLVFLSHHFIISGWDKPAESLRHQLADDVQNKLFAWYWGHEHRAAAYDPGEHSFYGASVGNGAFPDRWSKPSQTPTPVWYSNSRCKCFGARDYWPHGYAELEFQEDKLLETIHLEKGERLDSELTSAGAKRQIFPAK